jgi:hypothetical protein
MNDITNKLLELFDQKQSLRKASVESDEQKQLWSYRQAAAVLHTFSFDSLQPLDPAYADENPLVLLFDDAVFTFAENAKQVYTLKPEIRKQSLKQLGSREKMLEALKANLNRELTPLQKIWEEYLESGKVTDPEKMGYYQLTCLSQILTWVEPDPQLPSEEYVRDLIKRKSVLGPFEQLVISNFTGRERELRVIQKYITEPTAEPLLSIHGPGGVGKSALVGRFLWLNAQSKKEDRIPFAYLAFDEPSLSIEMPYTLLVDIASQLELQYPEMSPEITNFNREVVAFRNTGEDIVKRKTNVKSRGLRLQISGSSETALYASFALLIRKISRQNGDTPVVIVLDTFEEVQYRDREHLASLWEMLRMIRSNFELFRVIVAGRAPIDRADLINTRISELVLTELAPEDGIFLLLNQGVADKTIAEAVVRQIGGNPLALRLAANLISTDKEAADSSGIKGLPNKSLLFQVDEQVIQGRLYKRVLEHIHDEKVRKLAHPGMVLRKVTPEIILYVIAPATGITVDGLGEAQYLYAQLERETALVQTSDKGYLVYRPEIRTMILRLIEQDKYSEVRRLHREAIYYYGQADAIDSRAEEFYHRLVLNEDEYDTLDERWQPAIAPFVLPNLSEYSDRMKIWLATRTKVEVDRTILHNADIADWERNITRKVKLALRLQKNSLPALALLHERKERTNASPLFSLEAKAYLVDNQLDHAEKVLDAGIEKVSQSSNRGKLAELFWLQAQVFIQKKDYLKADQLLSQGERAMEKAENPVPLMHILCHRLLLRTYYKESYTETTADLRFKLNTACDRIEKASSYDLQMVITLTLEMLGKEFPGTAERLAGLVYSNSKYSFSQETLITENLQGLEEYREPWEEEDNRSFESLV